MLNFIKTRFHLFIIFLGLLFYSCEQQKEKRNTPPQKKIDTIISVKENEPKILPDSLLKFHLLGKCDFTKDTCFIEISSKFRTSTENIIYLQKEVCNKFIEMHNAAKKDSVTILIHSGARNFKDQKELWEYRWVTIRKDTSEKKNKIALEVLQKCAMPSTSRHHWGTDIDIFFQSGNKYFDTLEGKKQYQWMKKNAHKFGFHQVYTNKKTTKRNGYEEEKWHWSYIPIANKYTKKYAQLIGYKDITGFKGCDLAKEIKVIENYVYGIDKKYK